MVKTKHHSILHVRNSNHEYYDILNVELFLYKALL